MKELSHSLFFEKSNNSKFTKHNRQPGQLVLIKYGQPIPQESVQQSIKRRGQNMERSKEFVNELNELFNSRPIWSRKLLEEQDKFKNGLYLCKFRI